IILEAFKSNEYMSKYARVPHSYYYHYVKFVALTFCRPEDAIALTWSDIKTRSNGTFITFSKAYSRGVLKDGKTHEIRVFKCNEELIDFLKTVPSRPNDNNLLFPTPRSKSYMDQRSFGRDVWKPLVSKIANEGKVHKYLKFYSLRHSGITRLVRAGIDVATIARLAGTSPEMILNNYLAARNSIDLPPM
ncbi:MAG: tyrosine-type recombinase/integrase, partial [Cyanobacteria bacterium P01_G01_bin.19]